MANSVDKTKLSIKKLYQIVLMHEENCIDAPVDDDPITTQTNASCSHHAHNNILTRIDKIGFAQLLHSFFALLADVRERNIWKLQRWKAKVLCDLRVVFGK